MGGGQIESLKIFVYVFIVFELQQLADRDKKINAFWETVRLLCLHAVLEAKCQYASSLLPQITYKQPEMLKVVNLNFKKDIPLRLTFSDS